MPLVQKIGKDLLKEVDGLLKLFSESISKESKKIHSNNIKLSLSAIPQHSQKLFK